jgi:hypothetical protein
MGLNVADLRDDLKKKTSEESQMMNVQSRPRPAGPSANIERPTLNKAVASFLG